MNAAFGFKRLLVSFPPTGAGACASVAAAFADLFGVELVGLLWRDPGLGRFSGLPSARDISVLGGEWRSMEPARLGLELDVFARNAERRLAEVGRKVRRRFQLVQGGASALAEIAEADDILVLRAPAPADWIAEPQASLLRAALSSNAAVLFAPAGQVAVKRGAVVAISSGAGDPAATIARTIAEAIGERFEAFDWLAGHAVLRRDETLALAARSPGRRLLVTTRGLVPTSSACLLAAQLGAPLLILNPLRREQAASEN